MPAFHAPTDQKTDKAVAVFIAPGLEEVEALATVDILFRAGVPTTMISVTPERAVTSSQHRRHLRPHPGRGEPGRLRHACPSRWPPRHP